MFLPNLLITSLLFLNACQSANLDAPMSDGHYRKDLRVYLHSPRVSFEGFGVLPQQESYRLQLRSRKDPELVRISNCHRDLVFRDEDDKFSYTFVPNSKVESGSCILQFTFLDTKGYHQFGAITFRGDESLPASMSCNGEKVETVGASACQAKAGTLQAIEFPSQVYLKTSEGCTKPVSEGRRSWEFVINEGYCIHLFKSDDDQFHKLTTFGYTDFMKQ